MALSSRWPGVVKPMDHAVIAATTRAIRKFRIALLAFNVSQHVRLRQSSCRVFYQPADVLASA
jgi:hypothetical protein